MNLLLITLYEKIVYMFIEEIDHLLSEFKSALRIVFIIVGTVYSVMFMILVVYYLNKLHREFMRLKNSLLLIPYKKLSEDQTTHHLIKTIFKF